MHHRKFIFYAIIILFSFSCTHQKNKVNGVSFVASKDSVTQQHIDPVLRVNANYVSLMPFGFIEDLSSPNIIFNTNRQWFGEVEEGVLQYGEGFIKNKVKLMVKPQIWVWQGEFTGLIKMDSEAKWMQLEKSYTNFILCYAKTAQKLNADIFCIGTELEQFVIHRKEFWLSLINKIRSVYKGKLTYAANWDEYKRVPFLEKLDYIGIDAYFPLSEKQTPSIEEFEKGWQVHKVDIQRVQKEFDKPILFTEFGYRSVNFNAKQPWDTNLIKENYNHQAQINGLQAIHNQFWNEDWFAGGFVWKWFQDYGNVGGLKNNRFTPQNKPAEQTLKELYGINK